MTSQARGNSSAVQATWLVTGGAGYIGAHVVRQLLSAEIEVVVVDDLSTGQKQRLPSAVKFLHCSLEDVARDVDRLEAPIAGIIHLASMKNARESKMYPDHYRESIVGGTIHTLEIAKALGVSRVVLSSSCAVYGSQTFVDENSPVKPESPYGEAKAVAEEMVIEYARAHRGQSIVLRYFNVIGNDSFPNARDQSSGHLIHSLVQSLIQDEPFRVFRAQSMKGDGTCIRDYLDVRDVAAAHVLAVRLLQESNELFRGDIINLASGEGFSTLQIIRLFEQLSGRGNLRYELVDPASGDPTVVIGAEPLRAREILNWRPQFSVHESIASVLAGITRSPETDGVG